MKHLRRFPVTTGNIILGLAVYLPLESALLKFFPRSFQPAAYLLPEIVIWLTCVGIILNRLLRLGSWRRTLLDKPLLLFIFITLLTTMLNRSFSLAAVENVNALLKYVPAYFVAAHILRDGYIRFPARLSKIILGVAVIEIILGALQILNVPGIEDWLRPIAVQIGEIERSSIVIVRGREIGAIYGTLGDTVHYGWFLAVALIVALARVRVTAPARRWPYWILIAVLIVFIGFSYSRVLIVAAIFILFWGVFLRIRQADSRLTILLVGGLLAFVGIISVVNSSQRIQFQSSLQSQQSFIQDSLTAFTVRYRQIAYQYGRLGWLIEAPPTVLSNRPLFGFGPDRMQAYEQLYQADPNFITSIRPINTMEDVYWVALLIYYGLFGAAAWVWILIRHYRISRHLQWVTLPPAQRQIVWVALFYIPVMGVAQFANQAFEFRIASFYFWVFIGLLQGIYWMQKGQRPGLLLTAENR